MVNDCIFDGLEIGVCVGKIFGTVVGIRYRPVLG